MAIPSGYGGAACTSAGIPEVWLIDPGTLVETTGRERNRIHEARDIVEAVYGSVEIG